MGGRIRRGRGRGEPWQGAAIAPGINGLSFCDQIAPGLSRFVSRGAAVALPGRAGHPWGGSAAVGRHSAPGNAAV